MFEWLRSVYESIVGSSREDEGAQINSLCDVGNCLEARREMLNRKTSAINACGYVATLSIPLRISGWFLERVATVGIIGAVALILIFGVFAFWVLPFAILVSLAVIFLSTKILQRPIDILIDALLAQQEAFDSLLVNCPPECVVDLRPHECDLGNGELFLNRGIFSIPGISAVIGLSNLNQTIRSSSVLNQKK